MKITTTISCKPISHLLVGAIILLMSLSALADEANTDSEALVSIIIDDLGYRYQQDFQVVDLPAPIVCAILPHSPLSGKVASKAHRSGKEIILHAPMESLHAYKRLGPGALDTHMNKAEFLETLRNNLKSLPLAIGLNNHMGSLLTAHPIQMHWLMDELKQQGYAYIDSMTTNESVANIIAHNKNMPYLVRDIFLDHKVDSEYIKHQLDALVRRAKQKGYAVAIGHPHQETLDALQTFIEEAKYNNIKIVSMTDMLKFRKRNTSTLRTTALPKLPEETPITYQ